MEMTVASLIGCVGAAILLYWLRDRCRLVYGMLEITVGVIGVSILLRPLGPGDIAIITTRTEQLKWAAVIAGIYIMIRGMDNVYHGLSAQWRRRWDWVFHKTPGHNV
jgi:hypothetical protein